MADYQSIEVNTSDESQAYSEQDAGYVEQQQQEEAQETQGSEERPAWLPEKFESAEAMAEAYAALEAEYTKSRQDDEGGEESDDSTVSSTEPMEVGAFSQYTAEFTDTGDLSEESRQQLVDTHGLPREMVDGYVEGQKALLNEYYNAVYDSVGGEDQYNQMLEWASESLPEGEQEAFNNAVVHGSRDEMMFAVKSLASRWSAEGGQSNTKPLIQGDTGFMGASGAFRSLSELTEAMKDPRYQKDPAYRQDVENRLANSNVF